MTQKNETQVESKADTETKATPAKPAKTPVTQPDLMPEPELTKTVNSGGVAGELSLEVVELVTELRDTVKRID